MSTLYRAAIILLFLLVAALIFLSIRGSKNVDTGTPGQVQIEGRVPARETENIILNSIQAKSDLAIETQ